MARLTRCSPSFIWILVTFDPVLHRGFAGVWKSSHNYTFMEVMSIVPFCMLFMSHFSDDQLALAPWGVSVTESSTCSMVSTIPHQAKHLFYITVSKITGLFWIITCVFRLLALALVIRRSCRKYLLFGVIYFCVIWLCGNSVNSCTE